MAGLAFGLLVTLRVCKRRIIYELQTGGADARREGENTSLFLLEGEKQQLVTAKKK